MISFMKAGLDHSKANVDAKFSGEKHLRIQFRRYKSDNDYRKFSSVDNHKFSIEISKKISFIMSYGFPVLSYNSRKQKN